MQEDKHALFDSVDTVRNALDLFAAMLPELKINRERMRTAGADPQLFAMNVADYVVKQAIAFRETHATVAKIVAHRSRSLAGAHISAASQ
jgi:argininosuccinate lyase